MQFRNQRRRKMDWDCAFLLESQNRSHSPWNRSIKSFSNVPPSSSICLHRCTKLDPISISFIFNTSKTPQSTLVNHQADCPDISPNIFFLSVDMKPDTHLNHNHFSSIWIYDTSGVTGRQRGPKPKLPADYRAPSLTCTSYLCAALLHRAQSIFQQCLLYRTLSLRYVRAMRVFDVPAPSLFLDYFWAKFHFCRGLHCWASPRRNIVYSIRQSAYLMLWEPKLSLRNIKQYDNSVHSLASKTKLHHSSNYKHTTFFFLLAPSREISLTSRRSFSMKRCWAARAARRDRHSGLPYAQQHIPMFTK